MRFYSFMIMDIEQSTEADNEQEAKEIILLRLCNVDLSHGYFDEDVKAAKNTEFGGVVWSALDKASPFRDTIVQKNVPNYFDVTVRKLEWNHYTVRVNALSELKAEQTIEGMIKSNNIPAESLTKANAEAYRPGSYTGSKIIKTQKSDDCKPMQEHKIQQ